MKTIQLLLLITFLGLCACGNKADRASNDIAKASDSTQTQETPEASASAQTLTLKWKSVSSSEWGTTYEFEDQNGALVRFSRMGIPNFSEDENDYFIRTPVEGTLFAQYEIRSKSKDKWFEIIIQTTQEENENADDGSMMDVLTITAIKPH